MKIPTGLFLIGVFLTLLPNAFGQKDQERFVKNELLVKFESGSSLAAAEALHARLGSRVVEQLGESGWQRVTIRDGLDLMEAIARYQRSDPSVQAQPNFYYRLLATPNDPQYSNPGLYGLSRISAPSAWDIATGSSSVVVANIDTGMRLTHEDLVSNLWTNPDEIAGNGVDDDNNGFVDDMNGWDFRFNDNDPSDQHGHGTHTGGTIGAAGNNGVGIVGVNWNVRLMVIKIYNAAGNDTTSAMLINAYNYVRMMKLRGVNIRVSNNSYGGCQEACGYDQATKDAIDALGDAGVLNVFAAGNSGQNTETTPFFPGSYNSPSILNVASSTSDDTRSGFSNYGTVSVDLAAPGSGVYSTTFGSNSGYGNMSGTSMAAPHVSGAAALLAAHNPSLSSASIKATLMNTVDQLPAWQSMVKSGGRLNIANALQNPTVCSYQLSSSSVTLPTKGGAVHITVSAPQNCDFSVKSDSKWISVLTPAVMSGNAVISLWVTVNPGITRSGTVRVNGSPITVTQSRTGIF